MRKQTTDAAAARLVAIGCNAFDHPHGGHRDHSCLWEGITRGLGEFEFRFVTEEAIGFLEQNSDAVTGVVLGPDGTAVLEIGQRGDDLSDDVGTNVRFVKLISESGGPGLDMQEAPA